MNLKQLRSGYAEPQLLNRILTCQRALGKAPAMKQNFKKFWSNFMLGALLVNFGGPAGSDPTWRLETQLAAGKKR